jgi:glycosyltransferase involved in cell wall biosynthesis
MQATGWVLFTLAVVWIVPPVICFLWRVMRPATVDESHPRRVSVVVAACNEEAGIEATIRTLLDSVGVDIEVIPVNDRSTDQTGAIIDRMAATDSRVKPVHIKELPPGWLGKTHAMHVGAQRATSDALLFTDGDIKFDPRALHQACAYLEQHELDHLCLLPQLVPGGVLENACLSYFGFAYAVGLQLHLIRTGWPLSYAGVGAFNLVRTQFYREIGGHEQIAMDVLDDVKLGKMIRRAGGGL